MRFKNAFLSRGASAALSFSFLISPAGTTGTLVDEILEDVQNITKTIDAETVAGEYIVTFKDDIAMDDIESIRDVVKKHIFSEAIKGFAGQVTERELEALRNDPRVASIEPDVLVHTFAQSTPFGIRRTYATQSDTAMINGRDARMEVDIAILDTGVNKISELNVVTQVNFSRQSAVTDKNGHGTHVAGTAAAKDNKSGVVGMAPGARIWSVKVLGSDGSGYMSDIIKGIDYVTEHSSEIDVVNMSLGCQCESAALNEAIARSVAAGVVYVVAAGNDGMDAASFSPANHPDVITVSAIADFDGKADKTSDAPCSQDDQDDTLADFSNYGSVVDIAAPGVCILSTSKSGGTTRMSGTSMASPHVAGAAALFIVSSGKPRNGSEVASLKAALIDAGSSQSGSDGFGGDPDSYAEPLVNAAAF